ncbi:hypothetical protein V2J09_000221 [Rumex salicifolius]
MVKSTVTTPDSHPKSDELKFKGVRKRKWGKWVSEIRLPNSRDRIWLGSYDSPEKAARAFDAAQLCLRGPSSANLNFPDNPPQIDAVAGLSNAEIQLVASKFANSDPQPPTAPSLSPSSSPSCSVSISDGATVQWEGGDVSFDGGAGLYNEYFDFTPLGLDNYDASFGLGDFYTPPHSDSLDYYEYDQWNESGSENLCLWNF